MEYTLKNFDQTAFHDNIHRVLAEQFHTSEFVDTVDVVEDAGVFQLTAIVSIFQHENHVQLTMDAQGNVLNFVCDCGHCEEKACGHVGAVVKKLIQIKPNQFPYHYINTFCDIRKQKREQLFEAIEYKKMGKIVGDSRELMEEAIAAYEHDLAMHLQDEQYELVPSIEITKLDEIQISYRIGNEKLYVIRNIEEFMNRVDSQVEFSYGKSLSFIHKMEAFDENAIKQIEMLRLFIIQNLKKISEHDYYNVLPISRYLLVNEQRMDVFFDTYFETQIPSINFKCEESDELMHITIHQSGKLFIYSWDLAQSFIMGDKHLYKVTKSKIYNITRYALDNEGKTMKFLRKLLYNSMSVYQDENEKFQKYVLYPIKEYLDIDIVGQEDICELIKLYADIDQEEQMYVRLEYVHENGKRYKGFNETYVTNYTQDIVEAMIKKHANVIDYGSHLAYFDLHSESDDGFNFIYDALPKLSEYCEIYVSDALKKLGSSNHYSISIGVHFTNDLLSININSEEIPKEELSDILKAYRRKKKFYRLKNGQLLNLNSENLEELNEFVEEQHLTLSDLQGKIEIPTYRMFSLVDDMDEFQNLMFERDKQFQDMIRHWDGDIVKEFEIPSQYEPVLRDYQKDGFQWLSLLQRYNFNGILADDMGLGKTLQMIALLESKIALGTSIVVCPASLIYNWEDEIHKFSSKLKCACVCGNADERGFIVKDYKKFDVLITSYDYMRRDIALYDEISFLYVILDEAQNIKNQKTKNAISVKKLKAKHKIAMSGTPIENSLAELWSIFDFLMPNYLYNYHYFQKHYENDIVKNNNEEKQQKLKKLVTPFILRRTKKDVLKELPDKIDRYYQISFSEEEHKLYLAHLAQVNKELQSMMEADVPDKIAILAMLTKLRQLCCEPRLLFENIEEPSTKLKTCLELIESLRENKQKVLLFSGFTSMLDLIAEELTMRGISFYMLTGKTSKEDRRKLVAQFQKDDTTVFLISLKAGGTGLNLTSAEAVIHYDPWWNQSAQNQATDRAHRIGQTKNLQVFKLVMKNSIEEKIQELQLKKKELADMFVENNEGSVSKMSKEDIMQLFSV
ncbi:SNF2-related protein [Amedibacillus sp. YH-ame6]